MNRVKTTLRILVAIVVATAVCFSGLVAFGSATAAEGAATARQATTNTSVVTHAVLSDGPRDRDAPSKACPPDVPPPCVGPPKAKKWAKKFRDHEIPHTKRKHFHWPKWIKRKAIRKWNKMHRSDDRALSGKRWWRKYVRFWLKCATRTGRKWTCLAGSAAIALMNKLQDGGGIDKKTAYVVIGCGGSALIVGATSRSLWGGIGGGAACGWLVWWGDIFDQRNGSARRPGYALRPGMQPT